jgi:ABC-type transport system involved in multi-copper enzyme maturation permease subunit
MFWNVAKFEARYQAGNPIFRIAVAALFLLGLCGMLFEDLRFGSGPRVHENAPSSIAAAHLLISILFIFIPAAFMSNVIVRDDDSGFGPILRSTPITKFDYLIGRFTGAVMAAAIAFLAVPLGIWVGTLLPGIDPQTLGPNRLIDYAGGFLLFGLPNIFIASAIFFTLAAATRSTLGTFLGLMAILLIFFVTSALSSAVPNLRSIFALVEPFGMSAFNQTIQYWTPAESNLRLPAFEGVLLWNRLVWLAIAVAMLAFSYRRYSSRIPAKPSRRRNKALVRDDGVLPTAAGSMTELPDPRFGRSTARSQLFARMGLDLALVFKSPGFPILLGMGLLGAVGLLSVAGNMYGTATIPVTRHMILWLSAVFNVVTLVIAIYYAGELVWRDRERKFNDILDATPLPSWIHVVPKALAVYLVLLSTMLVGVGAAIAVQLLNGYTNLELHKYLLWYILPQSVDLMLVAVLAVFLQALSPNKFLGWGLMVLYFVLLSVAGEIGLGDNLFLYGQVPQVPYSDMNGAGTFWIGAWIFRIYWAAFAVLLLVAAHLLWRRGAETRLKPRLKRAPARLKGSAGLVATGALAIFLGTGAYAYYNTRILNPQESAEAGTERAARQEKRYLQYKALAQPTVSHVALNVALYPEEPRAVAQGRLRISNLTSVPIAQVHVRTPDDNAEILGIVFPGARMVSDEAELGYKIYRLDRPMAPGESRDLSFGTRRWPRGFRNGEQDLRLVQNGTFINAGSLMPTIGIRRPEGLRPARLEDRSATGANYMGGGWTTADIIVSTRADQTPIAPGRKVSERIENGRRTARFVSDTPILPFFSVQSARYAKKRIRHGGVDLAVFYHPQHEWNVDRMLGAMRASMDYYQPSFGPARFKETRITEFPAYATVAQTFANTIPYSEAAGFIADLSTGTGIDYVTYLTAHELAHQWWGYQVVGADVQGSAMLSETLAQYSALMVMKRLYGEDKIRQFLKFELDRYLSGRGKGEVGELPLARVENQPYIHYQKGSLAMYLLQDRVGEAAVNRALRKLVERYRFRGAPYPRSIDLIRLFREEARTPEEQSLITDLFERITLYDLQVEEPKAVRRSDGKWDVTVPVTARKLYAQDKGEEKEAPLNEQISIGLFTAQPGQGAFDRKDVLVMQRQRVRSGKQAFRFVTDKKPSHAGIDPYNFYIDRDSNDNIKPVI